MTQENQTHVKDTAKNVMARNNPLAQGRQLALWIGALIFGAVLGWMNVPFLNQLFNFIATVFTRLFQFIAVPTIALAVITTLSMMGSKEETKGSSSTPSPIPCSRLSVPPGLACSFISGSSRATCRQRPSVPA